MGLSLELNISALLIVLISYYANLLIIIEEVGAKPA